MVVLVLFVWMFCCLFVVCVCFGFGVCGLGLDVFGVFCFVCGVRCLDAYVALICWCCCFVWVIWFVCLLLGLWVVVGYLVCMTAFCLLLFRVLGMGGFVMLLVGLVVFCLVDVLLSLGLSILHDVGCCGLFVLIVCCCLGFMVLGCVGVGLLVWCWFCF